MFVEVLASLACLCLLVLLPLPPAHLRSPMCPTALNDVSPKDSMVDAPKAMSAVSVEIQLTSMASPTALARTATRLDALMSSTSRAAFAEALVSPACQCHPALQALPRLALLRLRTSHLARRFALQLARTADASKAMSTAFAGTPHTSMDLRTVSAKTAMRLAVLKSLPSLEISAAVLA